MISFKEAVNERRLKLYKWALSNMKELGCTAEPLTMEVSNDDFIESVKGCFVSAFYDHGSGLAILRCDWPAVSAVKFNTLLNFREIEKTAPKTASKMLKNGEKIHAFYNADIASKMKLKKGGIDSLNNYIVHMM